MSVINYEVALFCNVLSVDPIIIVGYGSPGPFEPAWTLCEALKHKRVHFLMGPWWSLQDPAELAQTMFRYKEMSHKYPNHSFTYMVNDVVDLELLQREGIPAVFCHQNAFVDDRVYRVIPGTEKKYDAIYNARLESMKRHILTSKFGSAAHIYYNCSGEKGLEYLSKIRRFLGNGVFLNEDPETGAYRFLNHSEICRYYNESRVGLCLSALEGAMYVSVEYLLTGLPVITTKNIGGRNFFLDPEYCMEVAPDPYAIRDAAEELTARRLSPERIRKKTLICMLKQRQIFIDLVQSIYDQEGVNRRFADEWETVYVNKMHVFGIRNWQVLTYLREHEGYKGSITTPMRRTYNVSPPGDFVWG